MIARDCGPKRPNEEKRRASPPAKLGQGVKRDRFRTVTWTDDTPQLSVEKPSQRCQILRRVKNGPNGDSTACDNGAGDFSLNPISIVTETLRCC